MKCRNLADVWVSAGGFAWRIIVLHLPFEQSFIHQGDMYNRQTKAMFPTFL